MACLLWLLGAADAAAQPISIAWDPNVEPEVTGYVVYYGAAPNQYDGIIDVGNQTTWTLTQTVPGRTYYFRVLAYTADGARSDLSEQVSETIPAPAVSSPIMALDIPRHGSSVSQNVVIGGWAADLGATAGSGVDAVHVWAYPNPGSGAPPFFVGAALLGVSRPDVAGAFGLTRLSNAGFMLAATLAPGVYDIVAFARSSVSLTFNSSRSARVTVVAPQSRPAMSLDIPSRNATVRTTFRVAGWALDFGATSGVGVDAVHAWGYPVGGGAPLFAGGNVTGLSRPDVGAAFGSTVYSSAGYDFLCQLPPGTYDLVVYARSTVTWTFNNTAVVRIVVQ